MKQAPPKRAVVGRVFYTQDGTRMGLIDGPKLSGPLALALPPEVEEGAHVWVRGKQLVRVAQ